MTSPFAWGQHPVSQLAVSACAVQPSYPLPTEPGQLQSLADSLQVLAIDKACLADAKFHAWRGAVLLGLGRPVEAVEPLERALMTDPDLPGAQIDLAQALSIQGDSESALALLEGVRARPDLDRSLRSAIETQIAALTGPPVPGRNGDSWQTRWRLTSFAGVDSNLNNGPANSEITLTLATGDLTLPLDASSRPRKGGAMLASAQWQGIKPAGDGLWVVQAELKARQTVRAETSYQQGDLAAAWLLAPSAEQQWVARAGASTLRFGGVSLLQAYRASLQRQFSPITGGASRALFDVAAGCRPTLAGEAEQRRYPSSQSLNGLYTGGAVGLLCRPTNGGKEGPAATAFLNIEARIGEDRPFDEARAGGVYRRREVRVQWERPAFANGQVGLQLTSTLQTDSEAYSVLLGNIPRRSVRHAIQLDGSWPLGANLSLVASAEAASQSSNIAAFVSRQRSIYFGLRWEK